MIPAPQQKRPTLPTRRLGEPFAEYQARRREALESFEDESLKELERLSREQKRKLQETSSLVSPESFE